MKPEEITEICMQVAKELKPSITEEIDKVRVDYRKDMEEIRKDIQAIGQQKGGGALNVNGLANELQKAFGSIPGMGSMPGVPQQAAPNPIGTPSPEPATIPGSAMNMPGGIPGMAGMQGNPMGMIQLLMSFLNTPVGAKLAGIEIPGMTQVNPQQQMMNEMITRGMISNFYNQTMAFQNMNTFMMKKMMADPKFIDEYNKTMNWMTEPVRNINNPNYKPTPPPQPDSTASTAPGAGKPDGQPAT